jgi:hypothetical protein
MENSDFESDNSLGIDFTFQNKVLYILVPLIIIFFGIFYYRNPNLLEGIERNMNIFLENMDFYKNKVLLSLNMDNGAVKSYSSL